jgi:hypothetical protein
VTLCGDVSVSSSVDLSLVCRLTIYDYHGALALTILEPNEMYWKERLGDPRSSRITENAVPLSMTGF